VALVPFVVGRVSDCSEGDPGLAPLSITAHRSAAVGFEERSPGQVKKTILVLNAESGPRTPPHQWIWLILAIFNLIAIPALTLLAGIVYHRIVIDWLFIRFS
jgi:hypothetical protein